MLDFAFYGLIPLGFVVADPAQNAVAGATLLFSFYVNGASFLAYAIMAERRGLRSEARGEKSLYFTSGLAEASETILVFLLFCLFRQPSHRSPTCSRRLTLVTAVARISSGDAGVQVARSPPPCGEGRGSSTPNAAEPLSTLSPQGGEGSRARPIPTPPAASARSPGPAPG